MSDFVDKDLDNFAFVHKLDIYMTEHKGFIAGGCFKNIINGDEIKDVDMYFENEEDFQKACEHFEDHSSYRPSYDNDKVVAFFNKRSKIRVELIKVMFGTPEEIISKFDFTVTKFAYYKHVIPADADDEDQEEKIEYRVIHHKDFFEHLHMKRLVVDNEIIRPGSTYERTYKYRDYGYKLCRESKIKIIEALRSPEFDASDLSSSLYDGMD